MFDASLKSEIAAAAARLGIEPAVLAAIVEVEAGGRLLARVNGRDEPLIRFEGHWFDRRLSGEARRLARAAGLASPRAGNIANPAGQAGRWRLLERAERIDRAAARESVSWGCGQVMGGHWKALGYDSVDALVDEARSGAAGQVRLMARYIAHAGLVPALRRHDWAAFARGYNGPAYAANAYDRRIAAAHARLRIGFARADPGPVVEDPPLLRLGDEGEAVRELQLRLRAIGQGVSAGGVFDAATARAVRELQARAGLDPDGIVGPKTRRALDEAVMAPGLIARILRLIRRAIGLA